jgi:hypothetical protein
MSNLFSGMYVLIFPPYVGGGVALRDSFGG